MSRNTKFTPILLGILSIYLISTTSPNFTATTAYQSLPTIKGAKVLAIMTDGFDETEYYDVRDTLRNQGATVLTASFEKRELYGDHGGGPVTPELNFTEVNIIKFHAVFIPGGQSPANILNDPRNQTVLELIQKADKQFLILSAICHGPWILAYAHVVDGKNVTGHLETYPALENAGGNVTDTLIERDSNIITAKYEGLTEFEEKLIFALAERVHEIIVNEQTFYVYTLSNSTVSNFKFNQLMNELSFLINGPHSTTGFCNTTIPRNLLDGNFTVTFDNTQITHLLTQNNTCSFIHITYTHSTHEIKIKTSTTLFGDINGDGKVNMSDIYIVVSAFGATPEDPEWTPNADVIKDNIINMKDIFHVILHYGENV